MRAVVGYHRPDGLEDALSLLNRGTPRSVVLAGGTLVNTTGSSEPVEMIDLQAIGIDEIRAGGETVEIGAMVRLAELAGHETVPEVVRDLARREGPNTFRNAATVGGTIAAADPESELLAGFLVYQGQIVLARAGGATQVAGLVELLGDPSMLKGSIITTLRLETDGVAAAERTGRTPFDSSIVAAVGRRATAGNVELALTGVASTPILVAPGDVGALQPPSDHRGSSDYRRHIAQTLTRRVMEKLGEQS